MLILNCSKYSDSNNSSKKPTIARTGATVLGAGAGLAASKLLNKKDVKRKKEILSKMKKGQASSTEIKELDKLKSKINKKTALATTGGAAMGLGATVAASKLKTYSDNKNKNK